MASQCALLSGEAAGEVSSMYSTPNSSSLISDQLPANKHLVQQNAHLRNLDLGLQVKESIGKLLPLSQC